MAGIESPDAYRTDASAAPDRAISIDVSIIIPTCHRPEGLERAVRSVFAQLNPFRLQFELVIVDNDRDGGARALAEHLLAEAPFAARYIHAAEPGVANARNAGIAATSGPLIAFLDDDEEASPSWLCELVGTQNFHEADVVFGPVQARLPETIRVHRAYFTEFFSRSGPEESGPGDRVLWLRQFPDPACGTALTGGALPGFAQ